MNGVDGLRQAIRYVIRFPLFVVISAIPADSRLWAFTAGEGGAFSGNTKYLFLHLQREQPGVDPVWLSTDRAVVSTLRDRGYTAYRRRSLRGRLVLARAGVAFLTHGNPLWPYTGNATVVQTWHGVGIKTMGRDEPEEVGLLTMLYRRYVFENWDHFVVTGAGKPASKYRSAFNLDDGQLLPTGLPRNDALFRHFEGREIVDNRRAIDRFERLSDDGPLVCYLPTWRLAIGKRAGIPLERAHLDLEALDAVLGRADANLVVKTHPMASIDLDIDGVENVHLLEESVDVYALLEHVDVLVTDYSSVFVDFLLLDRPIVFYTYDLEEYRAMRGFAFDFDEHTPGPRVDSPAELVETLDAVLGGADEHGSDRERMTREFHDHRDGNACRRLIDSIVAETGSKG